jgi:hypothetical protein
MLARRADGIHAAPYEQGEIGPDLFRQACLMGLEGLVSKHRERAYGAGRCTHWLKVKNPQHPAYRRVQDQFQLPARRASLTTGGAGGRNPDLKRQPEGAGLFRPLVA